MLPKRALSLLLFLPDPTKLRGSAAKADVGAEADLDGADRYA